MNVFLFLQNLIFINIITLILSKEDKSYLDSNRKLQNILIYIENDVPENGGKLLESIKEQISLASEALFEATSNMGRTNYGVQFGDVSIMVPSNWKIRGTSTKWQHCNEAHIKITRKTNDEKPFIKQIRKCGQPGDFIKFPVSFFNIYSKSKINSKKIMKAFVQLRYGVFSEEIIQNRVFTCNGETFISSACSEKIALDIPYGESKEKCSEPNEFCKYNIKKDQNHNYSIMFDQITPTSKYFCNDADRPHNKWAYNLHNKKCNKRSITSVILDHADFKNVILSNIEYEPPTFSIIKTEYRKIVLILDTSGSMFKVINIMKTAVQRFINDMVEDTAEIGIVTFNDEARILVNLTKMDSATNRKLVSDKINLIHSCGASNIGHGLLLGIEVLGGNILNDDKLYGTILLLSDGDNNENEQIDYEMAVENVIKKSVITNIISYNTSDQLLIKLSKKTGGRFVHADYNSSVIELLKKFVNVQKFCESSASRFKKVEENVVIISRMRKQRLPLHFDKHIGKNRIISLNIPYNDISKKVTPILITKDGKPIALEKRIRVGDYTTYTFKLPESIKSKELTVSFMRNSKYRNKRSVNKHSIKYSISGILTQNETMIIPEDKLSESIIDNLTENSEITATIDLSNCDTTQFDNISVVLELESPNKRIIRKRMMDDGIGDDSIDGDKIYTIKLFPNDLSIRGFYSLRGKLKMKNILSSKIIRTSVDFEAILVQNISKSALIDKIKPAQIQEPTIKIVNSKEKIIELKTIATGDNSMDGRISKYQILIHSIKDNIINKTILAEPYEKIVFVVNLSHMEIQKVVEISIRGVDNNNNAGKWSFSVPAIFN